MMKNKFVILCSLFLLLILGLSLLPDSKKNTTPAKQEISGIIDPSLLSDNTFQQVDNTGDSNKIILDLLTQETISSLSPISTATANDEIDSNSYNDEVEFTEVSTEAATAESNIIEDSTINTEDSIALEEPIDSEFENFTDEPINESISTTVNEPINSSIEPSFSEPITDSRSQSEILTSLLVENYAAIDYANAAISESEQSSISKFCDSVSGRLKSVSLNRCTDSNHRLSPFESIKGNPIVVTEFAPKPEKTPLGRVLIIGGTHGDELTSVSTAYEWISKLNKYHSGLFHWHIAPSINPDGLLTRPATRTNANGIDINRNLPTSDWDKQSVSRWEKASRNKRRNPGQTAGSELESRWIMHEIATFKPDAIISIHAPYGVLDFDSPELKNAPKKFGRLKLNLLGTYPGSLGNYAGIERQIPVLTLELPNATAMPKQDELDAIWIDMIRWLKGQF